MKTIKLITFAIFAFVSVGSLAQPKLSAEWSDENGAHTCDQNVNCNCGGSFIGVAFGSKVPPLSRTIVITIRNVGTGNLTVDTPTFTGSSNWTVTYLPPIGAGLSISTVSSLLITVVFNPPVGASVGNDLAQIKLHTFAAVDACFEDANPATASELDVQFNLSGRVLMPPINFILALDRSGSMRDNWGTDPMGVAERKIDKLRKAADFFVGLSSLRPPETGFTGDQLGLVKYSTVADGTYLPLSVVDPILVSTASSKLTKAASDDINLILPDGWTNMGDAVVKAFAQFPSGQKNVLVVFSDGIENQSPLTSDLSFVSGVLAPRQSDVDIYTIGMGNDVNATSMQTLSTNSGFTSPRYFFLPEIFDGGTSQVLNPNSSTFASMSSYELNSIYLKIYAEAVGYALPSDPEKNVCLCGGDQTIFDTWITSSDKHAIFSLFHQPGFKESYSLQLLNPQGTIIASGASAGGLNSKVVSSPDYTIYKVDFNGATNGSFVGKWTVRFTPRDSTKESYAPVGYGAIAFSDLTMETSAIAADYSPGTPIIVGVNLEESGRVIQKVKSITVKILTPSGKIYDIETQLDKYGTWVASFPNTFDQGTYSIFVKTTLANAKGELTTRENTKYVSLRNDYVTQSQQSFCYSCEKVKIITWVIIILIIIVLIAVLYKRKASV